jgi:glycosyltransferase involved in cell wall biosynthesis
MNHSAQKSKKIITVSQSTADEIVKLLNISPQKILVAYEGVASLSNSARQALDIPSGFLLHIGNLYPHKNIDLVLTSLKKLKKESDIKITFVIAGREDYFYQRVKNKVAGMGLTDQVHFLGEVPDTTLKKLYDNALALISPSLMEGFDLPVLEAMANNCLALVSDIPVHREICEDSAIYFDSSNEDSLLLKLKELYKNRVKDYDAKIKKAKQRSQNFTWEKTARLTLEVYEQTAVKYSIDSHL